ncbi:hypothetical protein AGR5A_Cc20036 [Agrobacterium genomosp. 5 str. CFBP 6626]|nr:hypothetical protein AGR5A_Cc20036 [Agrobacterium genomosp. 5 str. CFBP 6626]
MPLPEPIPRPTRIRSLEAPSLSLISLSFMIGYSVSLLVNDANEMLDRTDHAANRRSIFQGALTMHLVETQTDQRLTLDCRAANRAADLFDRNSLLGFSSLLGHDPAPYSSEALPEAARRA